MKLLSVAALVALCLLALVSILNTPVLARHHYQDDFIPGEVTVVLAPDSSIDAVSARYGASVLERIPNTTSFRLGLPSGTTVEGMCSTMESDSDVVAADPNFRLEVPEIRQLSQAFVEQLSQAFIESQSPVSFYQQSSISRLHLAEAQRLTTGSGITIAIIDTGIDMDHPLFAGRMAASYYDFVDEDTNPADEPGGTGYGHGTFVAGLISMTAPRAQLMPLRAFGPDGRGSSFAIARAIRYARDHGAQVINLSFGLLDGDGLIKDAQDYASGSFMVGSAGNDNKEFLQFPSFTSKTMSVGATTGTDRKASFSNYDRDLMVSAPGELLYSAYPGGRWASWSGTSFSTALVTGEAALMLSLNPRLNRSDFYKMIPDSGVNIDSLNPGYSRKLGRRIDYLAGAKLAQSRR